MDKWYTVRYVVTNDIDGWKIICRSFSNAGAALAAAAEVVENPHWDLDSVCRGSIEINSEELL